MTQQEFFERYKYNVKTDRIGGGGFGTVYRATDRLLHCKVAIKVSEVKIIGDKEFSLKAEFDAVGNLPVHPNIAHYEALFSFESPQGVFDYAVMQYYEDGNLKNLMDRGGLTMAQKEDIARGILDGIAFLHRNKVVHRDLKPANILICREGDDYVPLITDFGLSKGVEEMSKSGFSNSIAGGSPGYMSPEQIKGGRMQLNTDLWSYGVMVCELFSGRRLFQSSLQTGGTTEVNDMILHKDISGEIAALPWKWREVAERCLVRDNGLRAKNAEELYGIINGGDDDTGHFGYDEVTVVEEPEPTPTPKPGPEPTPEPRPTPQPKPQRNLTWLWVLLGVLVFGGVAFGVIDMENKRERTVAERESYERRKGFEYKTFTVNGVSFEMVAVKGGTFTMGATSKQGSDAYDSEKPSHSVTLSDYYIGKFEVTQELWEAVMGSNPSYFKGSKLPVECVSWDDCQTFIRKLNSLTGANFRLPTEAEWEFAARGGSKSKGYKYSGSNSINDVAWYDGNSGSKTHAVGTKSPNELGIYDMSGNVWEWCQDWYGSYSSGSQTNPQGPSSGSYRVLRGGSWIFNAGYCRVSNRDGTHPVIRLHDNGLRLALVL